jgi:ribosomal protein L1
MDEELFNLELRKFLKKFGITAQREIEKAVKAALESGRLNGSETLEVSATLSMGSLLPALRIDGEIALSRT